MPDEIEQCQMSAGNNNIASTYTGMLNLAILQNNICLIQKQMAKI